MTYQLLDSGDFEKLEQIGKYRVVRPAAQAVWRKTLAVAEWKQYAARYERFSEGKGEWQKTADIPAHWPVSVAEFQLQMKLTSFGHLGVFAEQSENWSRLKKASQALSKQLQRAPQVLNLFAYTGASSVACALGGAEIVHVDASKGTVDWAKHNFELNGLGKRPVRYIVEDVALFVEREVRRGRQYDGVILDPPTYGRGPDKQLWKIEEHLLPLMDNLKKLLNPQTGFVLLSCHSPGYTPLSLQNLMQQSFAASAGQVQSAEMVIYDSQKKPLPSGVSGWLQY